MSTASARPGLSGVAGKVEKGFMYLKKLRLRLAPWH
jgi:hypothetical protein